MIFASCFKILFFNDKKIFWFFLSSFSLAAAASGLLYFQISPQVAPLPLRYNIYFGIDFVGPWYYVFFLPLAGILINITHIFLGVLLEKKDTLFPRLLAINSLIGNLIITILAVLVVLLNS